MQKKNEFKLHGVMLINKPQGCTSFDVLRVLKRKLRTNQVGHTGTLDPMATGVMAVCFGDATKFVQYLTSDQKSYIAQITLGQSTDTYDADGEVIEEIDIKQAQSFDISLIQEHIPKLIGKITQTPPMYSAIKINGKRLYELARKGIEVDIPEREIEIFSLDLISFEKPQDAYPQLTIKVHCSKGTYIRSLAVDLGQLFHCPVHLSALQRTSSGCYQLSDCTTLEQIPDLSQHKAQDFPDQLSSRLEGFISMVNVLSDLPLYLCTVEEEHKLSMGQKIQICGELIEMQNQILSQFPQIKSTIPLDANELKKSLVRGINQQGVLISLLRQEDLALQVVKNFHIDL